MDCRNHKDTGETNNDKDEEGSPNDGENEVELTPGQCYMDNGELVIETNKLEDQEQSNKDDNPYRTEDDEAAMKLMDLRMMMTKQMMNLPRLSLTKSTITVVVMMATTCDHKGSFSLSCRW